MGAGFGKLGQRTIRVQSKASKRVADTRELVKSEFDRIQEAGTISCA